MNSLESTYSSDIGRIFFFQRKVKVKFLKPLLFNDMNFGASLSTKSLSNPAVEI